MSEANNFILNTYKRFPLKLSHGLGAKLYDVEGREYLDFASGIAVNSLGHSHPEIVKCISEQAAKILHVSNLYYTEPQLELAKKLVDLVGSGKIFFSNSGAEANECLIKLARSYGSKEGRYEIITMENSFHGRTMAGISATGQDKVKKGFYPLLPGFKHVPFNDSQSLEFAIGKDTVAIMLEGIQGEGGVLEARPEYLKKVRKLCDKHNLLLIFDSIQCGFFRTGNFQSYTTILGEEGFLPDAISMAKGLGTGVPIGASWIRGGLEDFLPQGSHGATFGGNALCTKVALETINIIERDNLIQNIRSQGEYLLTQLRSLNSEKIKEVRGRGLMIGIEVGDISLPSEYSDLSVAGYLSFELMKKGLLVVPAGTNTIRFLPSYLISKDDCDKALNILSTTL